MCIYLNVLLMIGDEQEKFSHIQVSTSSLLAMKFAIDIRGPERTKI